jgi:hypothetical protein
VGSWRRRGAPPPPHARAPLLLLPSLQELELSGGRVTDLGCRHLARLTELRTLGLAQVRY